MYRAEHSYHIQSLLKTFKTRNAFQNQTISLRDFLRYLLVWMPTSTLSAGFAVCLICYTAIALPLALVVKLIGNISSNKRASTFALSLLNACFQATAAFILNLGIPLVLTYRGAKTTYRGIIDRIKKRQNRQVLQTDTQVISESSVSRNTHKQTELTPQFINKLPAFPAVITLTDEQINELQQWRNSRKKLAEKKGLATVYKTCQQATENQATDITNVRENKVSDNAIVTSDRDHLPTLCIEKDLNLANLPPREAFLEQPLPLVQLNQKPFKAIKTKSLLFKESIRIEPLNKKEEAEISLPNQTQASKKLAEVLTLEHQKTMDQLRVLKTPETNHANIKRGHIKPVENSLNKIKSTSIPPDHAKKPKQSALKYLSSFFYCCKRKKAAAITVDNKNQLTKTASANISIRL